VTVAEYALGPIGELAAAALCLVAQCSQLAIPAASLPQSTQDVGLVEKLNSLRTKLG